MKLITSAHNEQLKYLAKLLSQTKARREHGQTVLEGVHLLQSYLQAGLTPLHVYLPEAKAQDNEIRALLRRLDEERITWVSNEALSKITSLTDADDIMTLIQIPPQEDYPTEGDCVVLERVQDPGNVGTIIRSAAAAGVSQLLLSDGSVDVWSPKVLRAAMGAHFLLSIHTRVFLRPWLAAYRHEIWATALGEHNNFSLYQLDLRQPSAWIFGNEGSGISTEVLEAVSGCVKIPMLGQTESLNVAMAATVCLFEQMRQRL
ncbi:TrmH family RNA methyltransferase [Neisseria perflava]|uniref:TrmH family RNA methyltransferase n=1 Tax=Neisseria perflava TaxID=33053 RepID=UPI00209F3861|nr:RNA methyltransferase [Neisseria perflava]MCP1660810.1 TrmH family RNA methyltransferase [Neisseria perflava]MCP1773207.1 TrmH family RNA methyltransferase [Neisseria perflava]